MCLCLCLCQEIVHCPGCCGLRVGLGDDDVADVCGAVRVDLSPNGVCDDGPVVVRTTLRSSAETSNDDADSVLPSCDGNDNVDVDDVSVVVVVVVD